MGFFTVLALSNMHARRLTTQFFTHIDIAIKFFKCKWIPYTVICSRDEDVVTITGKSNQLSLTGIWNNFYNCKSEEWLWAPLSTYNPTPLQTSGKDVDPSNSPLVNIAAVSEVAGDSKWNAYTCKPVYFAEWYNGSVNQLHLLISSEKFEESLRYRTLKHFIPHVVIGISALISLH